MCKDLTARNAIRLAPAEFLPDGQAEHKLPRDYFDQLSDNTAPVGRMLGSGMAPWMVALFSGIRKTAFALDPLIRACIRKVPRIKEMRMLREYGLDLSYGIGFILVNQLQAALAEEKVPVMMGQAVTGVVLNRSGEVVGVRATDAKTGQQTAIRARRGVVFGSGGFGNNREMHDGLRGPIDGTGASCGNTGDFQQIAGALGCQMSLMDSIWGGQCLLEATLDSFETSKIIFQMRGDGFFLVNGEGKRVVNEKLPYDLRMRAHWEIPNTRYMIYVTDLRNVDEFGSDIFNTVPADPDDKIYIKGESVEELGAAIRKRFEELAPRIDAFDLADDFDETLASTLQEFNRMAVDGVDKEFGRGATPYERQWSFRKSELPNPCLHPLNGPLYALLVAPAALDTKGGAAVDLNCQCLRSDGSTLPGLYGAGNAIASPSGDAYWSGGATIGVAMTTGYVAGQHAASSKIKDAGM
eukprot:TRINITY_DN1522_c0_g2_i4.p1 TRINITY_DN1522_c0_g2~~TRINITY_DN1522_c0_g2_i4.p1  ORF type:complete len:467 (-),score=75.65 TRINITY_DN1522_c0_g2_i4:93-1493(-)